MREIKFRGWKMYYGGWAYGSLIYDKDNTWSTIVDEDVVDHIVETSSVGQYTGLKDKNEKEIYEGDVVWCRAGERRSGIWEYEKRFAVEYGWTQSMLEMSMCDEIEVIGNIYDNPELLEEMFMCEEIDVIGNIYDNPGLLEGQ